MGKEYTSHGHTSYKRRGKVPKKRKEKNESLGMHENEKYKERQVAVFVLPLKNGAFLHISEKYIRDPGFESPSSSTKLLDLTSL